MRTTITRDLPGEELAFAHPGPTWRTLLLRREEITATSARWLQRPRRQRWDPRALHAVRLVSAPRTRGLLPVTLCLATAPGQEHHFPMQLDGLDLRTELLDLAFRVGLALGWGSYTITREDHTGIAIALSPRLTPTSGAGPYRDAQESTSTSRPIPPLDQPADYRRDALPLSLDRAPAPAFEQMIDEWHPGTRIVLRSARHALWPSRAILDWAQGTLSFPRRGPSLSLSRVTGVALWRQGRAVSLVVLAPAPTMPLVRLHERDATGQADALAPYAAELAEALGVPWFTNAQGTDLYGVGGQAGSLYAVGPERVLRSTDDGRTWSQRPAPDDADLYGVSEQDGVLHVVGRSGIFRSTDQGQTWTHTQSKYALRAVLAGPGGRVLAAGENAILYRSEDAGQSWEEAINLHDPNNLLHTLLGPLPSGEVFALGARGLLVSDLDGEFWREVSTPGHTIAHAVVRGASLWALTQRGEWLVNPQRGNLSSPIPGHLGATQPASLRGLLFLPSQRHPRLLAFGDAGALWQLEDAAPTPLLSSTLSLILPRGDAPHEWREVEARPALRYHAGWATPEGGAILVGEAGLIARLSPPQPVA